MEIHYKKCSRDDCIHGDDLQPITNFYKNKNKSDGHDCQCKDCSKKHHKEAKAKNLKNNSKLTDDDIRKKTPLKKCTSLTCLKNGELQSSDNFTICRTSHDGLSAVCKDCQTQATNKIRTSRKSIERQHIESQICSSKTCDRAGEIQPIENFGKDPTTKNGYDIYCKDCRRKLRNLPAKYDTYADRLSLYEEVRRNPDNFEELQVRCFNSKCGKWFTPTIQMVQDRLRAINSIGVENHFYCGDHCKQTCDVFNTKTLSIKKRKCNRSDNMQSDLRDIVLAMDNYTCQMCEKSKEEFSNIVLICHHIKPMAIDLMLASDVDNCITLCDDCHKKVHNLPGCQLHELQKKAQEQREKNQLK